MSEAMTREAEGVARTTGLKKEMRAEYVRRYVEQGPAAAAQWVASQAYVVHRHVVHPPAGSDVEHAPSRRPLTAKNAKPAVPQPRTPKGRPAGT
jgi:hypothetical protein